MIGQTLFDIIAGLFKLIVSEEKKENSSAGETNEKLSSQNDEKSLETNVSSGCQPNNINHSPFGYLRTRDLEKYDRFYDRL
ncbi:hypothetical protein COBT_000962, partial [Conglomerata obtusa]